MATTTAAAPGAIARVAHEIKRPYVQVFGFLGLVTLIEVQIPSLGQTFRISETLQVVLLMSTAAVKAALVALYYMHLKYEPRILKLLPVAPLAFVILLLVVLSTA